MRLIVWAGNKEGAAPLLHQIKINKSGFPIISKYEFTKEDHESDKWQIVTFVPFNNEFHICDVTTHGDSPNKRYFNSLTGEFITIKTKESK